VFGQGQQVGVHQVRTALRERRRYWLVDRQRQEHSQGSPERRRGQILPPSRDHQPMHISSANTTRPPTVHFVVFRGTVRTQIRATLFKLEVHSHVEAVALATRPRSW
jgi:hypothetical protein